MVRRRVTEPRRQRGVTLLELLVVISILAFVTAIAVFNAPPPRSSAKEEAERFAARLDAAWQSAVLSGSVTSIEIGVGGYAVKRYANGEWVIDDGERQFGERAMPRGVAMAVTLQDAAVANRSRADREESRDALQRIIIDPVGVTTPFVVEFTGDRQIWRVRNEEDQSIVLENAARR